MSSLRVLTEVGTDDLSNKMFLREIIINPDHVAMIREDPLLRRKLVSANSWPEGLDDRAQFCKVHLNSSTGLTVVNVVGDLSLVVQKLGS